MLTRFNSYYYASILQSQIKEDEQRRSQVSAGCDRSVCPLGTHQLFSLFCFTCFSSPIPQKLCLECLLPWLFNFPIFPSHMYLFGFHLLLLMESVLSPGFKGFR